MEKAQQRFALELDQEHVGVLQRALDFYVDIGIGKLDRVIEAWIMNNHSYANRINLHRAEIKMHLDIAKFLMAELSKNGGLSIRDANKVGDEFRNAYDILQVIRHETRSPDDNWSVASSKPWKSGSLELVSIKEIKDEDSSLD